MTAFLPPAIAPLDDPARPLPPAWLADHRHFLLDLDGTLLREREVMDGAPELLRQLEGRYAVVSNNSVDTAQGLARKLERLGLRVPADRLVLAGQFMVETVANAYPCARVMLLASPALTAYARKLGCVLVDGDAELVVLALDKRFDYAKLYAAANAVARGARLIAANPDLHHPAPGNRLMPETGALLRAVTACAGAPASLIVGKPEPTLFEEGLRRLGARAAATLVIGDNPATDGLGAARMGMRYLLLGSGGMADAETPAGLLRLDRRGHAEVPAGASMFNSA